MASNPVAEGNGVPGACERELSTRTEKFTVLAYEAGEWPQILSLKAMGFQVPMKGV